MEIVNNKEVPSGGKALEKHPTKYVVIGLKEYPVYVGFYGDLYVKYKNRSRLIHPKELFPNEGYIENNDWTINFEIKER